MVEDEEKKYIVSIEAECRRMQAIESEDNECTRGRNEIEQSGH